MAEEKKYPITFYHPEHKPRTVINETEEQMLGSGWQQEYIHQEFPKAMHHKDQESVIVNSQEEQDALGDGWHEVRSHAHGPNTTGGDAKSKGGAAQALGAKHVAYAQSCGWPLKTVEALRKFLSNLKPAAAQAFMDEVEAWKDPKAEGESADESSAGAGNTAAGKGKAAAGKSKAAAGKSKAAKPKKGAGAGNTAASA